MHDEWYFYQGKNQTKPKKTNKQTNKQKQKTKTKNWPVVNQWFQTSVFPEVSGISPAYQVKFYLDPFFYWNKLIFDFNSFCLKVMD